MSSAPRCGRSRSRASWRARWRSTRRSRSRAPTCPTSTSSGSAPEDRERFEGVEHEVTDELSAYLLEHARREKLALVSRPQITFDTDERLRLGEFGIQARLVRAAAGGRRAGRPRPHDGLLDRGPRAGGAAGLAQRAAAAARCCWPRASATPSAPGGATHRAQPRVRHRPGRHQRLAPARRAAPAGRRLDDHRPRLDQRRARQRARRARQRAARRCSPATASRSGTVDARFEVD